MNSVEQRTWDCLQTILREVDPDHKGWAVDAGLGWFDFYCEWFKRMGFQTLAVEPSPTHEALQACKNSDIPLVEAALGSSNNSQTLYQRGDLLSLTDLWGDMEPLKSVEVLTLETLVRVYGLSPWTVLKLDTEGAEPAILSVLPDLDTQPQIISLEWGGVKPAGSGDGIWRQVQDLRDTFKMLWGLNYRGILIGAGQGEILRPMRGGKTRFDPTDVWGNAVLVKDWSVQEVLACCPS